MKSARPWQLLAGVAIAAAGLWFFLRDVDAAELARHARAIRPLSVAAGMALCILSLWLRSLRWRVMLPAAPAGGDKKGLFGATMIGFMVNNILPARVGEAVRVLILWKRNRYAPAAAVGSLLLERGIDALAFGSLFYVPVFILGLERLRGPAVMVMAVSAAVIAGMTFYAFVPAAARAMFTALTCLLPGTIRHKAQALLDQALSNLDWIFSPARTSAVILLSFGTVLCWPLIIYLLVDAGGPFTLLHAMVAQSFAIVGVLIPLSPGYVGSLHAVLWQGLVILGVDKEAARAITIVYHAVSYIPITIIGLVYFMGTNISFREISRAGDDIRTKPGLPG